VLHVKIWNNLENTMLSELSSHRKKNIA
jgi:hypothetical protein